MLVFVLEDYAVWLHLSVICHWTVNALAYCGFKYTSCKTWRTCEPPQRVLSDPAITGLRLAIRALTYLQCTLDCFFFGRFKWDSRVLTKYCVCLLPFGSLLSGWVLALASQPPHSSTFPWACKRLIKKLYSAHKLSRSAVLNCTLG